MMMDVQVSELAGGQRVVTARIPHVQSVSIGLWVGVGGRYEARRLTGISHFIEHMLFKGTKTRSARDISQSIEGRGGHVNAMTQEDCTGYYAHVGYDHAWETLDILVDMYSRPKFAPDELERERGVIVEEIMMYKDRPHHQVQELMSEAMWVGHPVARSVAGTRKAVTAMTRRDLIDFKERHYIAANTVVAFAGQVEHDRCVAEVARRMSRSKAGRAPGFRKVTARTTQKQVNTAVRPTEQVHLCMGLRLGFGRKSRHRYALTLLNVMLGDNMSSRLFQTVRERYGLAYSIHSSLHLLEETGALTISGGLDRKRYTKALSLVSRELKKLKDRPVPRAELQRAKDYAIGGFRLALESTTSHMVRVAENMMYFGRFVAPEDTIARLESVTREEILALSQRILREQRASVAIVAQALSDSDRRAIQDSALGF